MVKVNRSVWMVADIAGMMLLVVGVLGFIEIISADKVVSEALMAAGMALIVISAVFIQAEGKKLRKESEEFRRVDEIRKEMWLVPNDLEEGYQIDFTANPRHAIKYRNNGPVETHSEADFEEVADNDVLIRYLN